MHIFVTFITIFLCFKNPFKTRLYANLLLQLKEQRISEFPTVTITLTTDNKAGMTLRDILCSCLILFLKNILVSVTDQTESFLFSHMCFIAAAIYGAGFNWFSFDLNAECAVTCYLLPVLRDMPIRYLLCAVGLFTFCT